MNIVDKIRDFVESECRKPGSKYGYEPFVFHFVPVVNYARKLTNQLGGDKEVVILAAWLHDIGSIIYGRANHHITSSQIAEEELSRLHYPPLKIDLIKKCILNHRASQGRERLSIEEKILAEADAMSAFESIGGLFKAALVYEKLPQKEARDSVMAKLERKWQALHFPESRELLRDKYEAAKLLLKSN
jgi:uncharacterized protein